MWIGVTPTPTRRLWKAIGITLSDPSVVVLIMLGAGINFSVGFVLINASLNTLFASQAAILFKTGLPSDISILAGSYFLMGLVYSTVASLALKPKRMVNPLFVQIVTASFVPILVYFVSLTYYPNLGYIEFAGALTASFLLALLFFMSAGIGQFLAVRYLVGINGTKDDTRRMTMVLDSTLENTLKVLDTESVHTTFRLELVRPRTKNLKVFRTIYDAYEQFYLMLMQDPNDKNKTQLATVAYEQGFYGIQKGEAGGLDRMRKEELKRVLSEHGIAFEEKDSPEAVTALYYYALEPTQAKILSVRSFAPHVWAITAGIVAMFLVMSLLFITGLIGLDLYATFVIFAALSLLFEFLPMLRRRNYRPTDEFESG